MIRGAWIPIKKGSKENAPSVKRVNKSGLSSIKDIALEKTKAGSTQVTYTLSGIWKSKFNFAKKQFDVLTVPGAGHLTDEGLPEIPQEGIFVAIPNKVSNIKVKVVKKNMQSVPGNWRLKPSPKPIIEEEYIAGKEQYRPKSKIYNSNTDFPGKDFDYLGVKSLEGIPVAHIIIYLAQYKPKSGKLSVVRSITIEVSYDIPPQSDAIPHARTISSALRDMILDIDHIQEFILPQNITQNMMYKELLVSPPLAGITPGIGVISEVLGEAILIKKLKRTEIISEYVIITTDALKASVQPLLTAKSGWPHYAMIATTTDITAEFPTTSLKESIRAFLTWAWENWQCPPRYVVLAGDVDTIPTHLWSIGGGTYASDHYYADIRDNLSPEIVVSRIPTSDSTTLQEICENLAQYSNSRGPDWGDWQNRVALVAYEGDTYKDCSDDIATAINPRFSFTKLYGDTSTRQQVVDRMNSGVLIANYRGHGSKTEWSSANGLRTAEIRALNNDNLPPMVFCICCQNAWIDDQNTEVVVETFLREGKCVSVLGASRNSPTYANNDFNKYLWQAVMDSGDVTPGQIVLRAKAAMIRDHGNSTTHQQDVVMYMLFGDPTAKVASTAEFLRGTWDMDHDGWKGMLVINRIWQSRVERIGSCGYPVWSFSGTYTGSNGQQFVMEGKIGGQDQNDGNSGCKRSDHRVSFYISFPNNKQKFDGYITTWTRNVMAGYTWWSKRPFGWYAKKR